MFVATVNDACSLKPLRTITRRVGNPKLQWVEETIRRAWGEVKYDAIIYNADITQHNLIKASAIMYALQFETRKIEPYCKEEIRMERERGGGQSQNETCVVQVKLHGLA